MIQDSPSAHEPVLAELPTSRAKLEIQAGLLMPSDIAPGQMRSDRVKLLIVALGVLGSAVTGTAGAILIERIAPKQANLAFADLMLAFAAALVIAAYGTYGMAWGRRRPGPPGSAAGRPSITRAAARAAREENV